MEEDRGPKTIRISGAALLGAIAESSNLTEAARKLGIPRHSLYYTRRKLGLISKECKIDPKTEFAYRARPPVPDVVIQTADGRRFVGTLTGTEGCVTCAYCVKADMTELVLVVEMTDRDWIVEFARTVGLSMPPLSGRGVGPNRKPKFRRSPSGRRALRILNEVLPFLYGQRLKEAERALEFFSPSGSVKGRVKAAQIWGDLRS